MKSVTFQPDLWVDLKKDQEILIPDRTAHLKLSAPGTVHAKVDGKWQLVHHGDEMKIQFPSAGYTIKCSVAAALYVPAENTFEDSGEVLTNMDKRQGVSGAEAMVFRMMRVQQLKEQSKQLERAEQDAIEAQRRIDKGLTDKKPKGVKEKEEPVIEDEPDETTTEEAEQTTE